MKKLPSGFRTGHTDNLACPHRDITCCSNCAEKHVEIVEVGGQHFWVPDEKDREAISVLRNKKDPS